MFGNIAASGHMVEWT